MQKVPLGITDAVLEDMELVIEEYLEKQACGRIPLKEYDIFSISLQRSQLPEDTIAHFDLVGHLLPKNVTMHNAAVIPQTILLEDGTLFEIKTILIAQILPQRRFQKKRYLEVTLYLFHQEVREYVMQLVERMRRSFEFTADVRAGQRTILQLKKPGRPKDLLYTEAWEKIRSGEDEKEVFKWFLKEAGITKPDKGQRDAFKAAMKRRNRSIKHL